MLTAQEASEQRVFLEFVRAANLTVDSATVRNEKPPLPDISCNIGGTPYLFELGEIIDQDLAADIHTAQKQKVDAEGGWSSEIGPLIRIMRKKASTTYTTNGAPIDLLLYYETQSPFAPSDYLKDYEVDVLAALLPS